MKHVAVAIALSLAPPLAAQVLPEPGAPNPRLQTVRWQDGKTIQLTALPATGLTVLFEPGESVRDLDVNAGRIDARISSERDGLLLIPRSEGNLGTFAVTTDRRQYRFALRTGSDLMAAYLVRFVSGTPSPELPPAMTMAPPGFPSIQPAVPAAAPSAGSWTWRVKGDAAVRPASISDDGVRTLITFPDGQPLPAIFAIGPAGGEQVVNGYMRQGVFVIDEVWPSLVFRIDARKAIAERIVRKVRRRG